MAILSAEAAERSGKWLCNRSGQASVSLCRTLPASFQISRFKGPWSIATSRGRQKDQTALSGRLTGLAEHPAMPSLVPLNF